MGKLKNTTIKLKEWLKYNNLGKRNTLLLALFLFIFIITSILIIISKPDLTKQLKIPSIINNNSEKRENTYLESQDRTKTNEIYLEEFGSKADPNKLVDYSENSGVMFEPHAETMYDDYWANRGLFDTDENLDGNENSLDNQEEPPDWMIAWGLAESKETNTEEVSGNIMTYDDPIYDKNNSQILQEISRYIERDIKNSGYIAILADREGYDSDIGMYVNYSKKRISYLGYYDNVIKKTNSNNTEIMEAWKELYEELDKYSNIIKGIESIQDLESNREKLVELKLINKADKFTQTANKYIVDSEINMQAKEVD